MGGTVGSRPIGDRESQHPRPGLAQALLSPVTPAHYDLGAVVGGAGGKESDRGLTRAAVGLRLGAENVVEETGVNVLEAVREFLPTDESQRHLGFSWRLCCPVECDHCTLNNGGSGGGPGLSAGARVVG